MVGRGPFMIVVMWILAQLMGEVEALTKPFQLSSVKIYQFGTYTPFGSATTRTNGSYSSTITFANAFVNKPYVILGIITFKTNSRVSMLYYSQQATNIIESQFVLNYTVGVNNTLRALKVRYFATSQAVSFAVLSNYYYSPYILRSSAQEETNSRLIPMSSFAPNTTYTSMTTPLHHNRIYFYMNGFEINSTGGNVGNIRRTEQIHNSTVWNMTIYKPANVFIGFIRYDIILMSSNFVPQSSSTLQWGGYINTTSSGDVFVNSSVLLTPYLMYGMSSFQPSSDSSVFDYQVTGTATSTSTTLNISAENLTSGNIGMKSVLTSYSFFIVYTCYSDCKYSHVQQNQCYDACPSNTIFVSMQRCAQCAYQCATCSVPKVYEQGPNCLSCPSGRVLSNGSCTCSSTTSFDDGYSGACRLCNATFPGTQTCLFYVDPNKTQTDYKNFFLGDWSITLPPYFTSLSCDANYYVYNGICRTCQQIFKYCLSCTNASECATCDTSVGAKKSSDGKCYVCNINDCTQCSQDNYCSQCALGYAAIDGACVVPPCDYSCQCGGYALPKINGSCSTLCGDGIVAGDEQCDDGNTINHDGCSSTCQVQTCIQNCTCGGYTLPVVNDSCSTICGDGMVAGLEQCDDGNTVNRDGCSQTCVIEGCNQTCNCGGYVMPLVNNSCSTVCGDGIRAGMEQCDDGNLVANDGCSSTCTDELCDVSCSCGGWVLPLVDGVCSTVCGDGFMRGSQECDDGNLVDYDGCSSTCQSQGCNVTCNCQGWGFPRVNGLCTTTCGDGVTAGTQQCDDGNTANHDGCSSTCQNETCDQSCLCGGYTLPIVNGTCSTVCGDGILAGSQECDDGNNYGDDGCSPICMDQHCDVDCSCGGWVLPLVNGVCSTLCGDWFARGSESCDDGNTNDFDGCSSQCRIEGCNITCDCDGWSYPRINGICTSTCGDGIVTSLQQCDDGNTAPNDGCSSNCTIQATACKVSCQCDGYQLPVIDGLCSTRCGDGMRAGDQECDDGNLQNGDGCSAECRRQSEFASDQSVRSLYGQLANIFTVQKTQYASMVMFLLGFRLIGMEMLWVYQSFQLLLYSQSSVLQISDSIHGYSDPESFPYRMENMQNQLFDRFNYMFFAVLVTFCVGVVLQAMGQMCKGNNQVKDLNDMEGSAEGMVRKSLGPKYAQKSYNFDDDLDDDDGGVDDFTVHYEKRQKSKIQNDLLSSSLANSQLIDQSPQSANTLPFTVRVSRTITRQVFFDMIVNLQPIVISTFLSQICHSGIQSVLNFPTLISVGCLEVFLVGLMGYLWVGRDSFFGENRQKFKDGMFFKYWLVNVGEQILVSAVVGVRFGHYLYVVVVIKFVALAFLSMRKMYKENFQNYRCIVVNFLHLALLVMFALDTAYIQPNSLHLNLPSNLIVGIYTGIIAIVFAITGIFLVKDLITKCGKGNQIANFMQQEVGERIFDSRRYIEESRVTKFKDKNSLPESTIFEDIRSRKLTRRDQNRERGRYNMDKRSEFDSQQESEQNFYTPKRTFLEDQPYEVEFQSDDVFYQSPPKAYQRSQRRQGPSDRSMMTDSRVTRSRRPVKTARRYDRERNENKQNFQQQWEQSEYGVDNRNYKSLVRDYGREDDRNGQSKVRHAQLANQVPITNTKSRRIKTQHNTRSPVRNVAQSDEYMNDFEYGYDGGQMRYR